MRFTERVGPWPLLLTCLALVAPGRDGVAADPSKRSVAFRRAYPPDQVVFDVGFRVLCEADDQGMLAQRDR